MPPKKKKSGKGKKKKGKKSGKKKDQVTFQEAVLAFQTEIKEKSIEDLTYELRALKEKNERLKLRNKRLKEEQLEHIRTLLKQVKVREKEIEQLSEVGHEQVEKALLDKLDCMKQSEQHLQDIRDETKNIEGRIVDAQAVIDYRTEYKNHGQHEHAKQIYILKQELEDMEQSYKEVKEHLDKSLKIAKEEIEAYTEKTVSNQKQAASKKAIQNLDKKSQQEILDNGWLKKEVAIHTSAHKELVTKVESLEAANLELMTSLFDCRVEDFQGARKFYLTCVKDLESSDEEEEGEMEEEEEGDHDQKGGGEYSEQDPLQNYFDLDEDEEENEKLNALEMQLLNVVGEKKQIIREESDIGEDSKAESSSTLRKPSETWPVTNNMLQTLVQQ